VLTESLRGPSEGIEMADANTVSTEQRHPHHELTITIDRRPHVVDYKGATAVDLLRLAGKDPANHYLVQIIGKRRISYKDTPDEPIELHEDSKFVTIYDGGTHVS